MFNKSEAIQYINQLCKKHKIKIIGYSTTSSGYAIWKSKSIKIPKPTNVDRLGVCLHEIKHIIDGNKGKRYEQEFYCDLYAMNMLKELGHDTTDWERRMRWHSLSRIAMAVNRGLSIDRINADIREFFKDVDFTLWINKKVFVSSSKINETGYIIQLTENISKSDVEMLLNRKGLMLEKSKRDDSTYNRWIVHNGSQIGPDYDNLSDIINYYQLAL